MKYKINEAMQSMPIDETNMVIFDPATGNSHVLEETGVDIYQLCDGRSYEDIVKQLGEKYNAQPGEIERDVEEFLVQLVEKQIVFKVE